MCANRRFKFTAAVVIWTSIVLTVLVAIGMFSYEVFFVLALVSYLAAVELGTPGLITLPWSRRLHLFSLLGLAVMAGILIREALDTLPEALLP